MLTYAEMWEKYDSHRCYLRRSANGEEKFKVYSEVRSWTCTDEKMIFSKQMKRFRQYIKDKEKIVSILPSLYQLFHLHLFSLFIKTATINKHCLSSDIYKDSICDFRTFHPASTMQHGTMTACSHRCRRVCMSVDHHLPQFIRRRRRHRRRPRVRSAHPSRVRKVSDKFTIVLFISGV